MPTPQERAQIRAIVRGVNQLTERSVRAVTLLLHERLVRPARTSSLGTPVDLGWARANWVPRIGRPHGDEPVGDRTASGVQVAQAAAQAGVSSLFGYRLSQGAVFVTNNVPYIERLNDGYSPQQGAGFVQRAIRDAVRVVVQ